MKILEEILDSLPKKKIVFTKKDYKKIGKLVKELVKKR